MNTTRIFRKRRNIIFAAVAAGIILITLIAFIVLRFTTSGGGIMVKTMKVSKGRVTEYIECTGTVAEGANANVTADAPGVIQAVHVSEGAQVNAGDLLFTIEQTENPALIAAQAELDRLDGEYQQQLLFISENNNATDRTVQIRRTELQRAIAARDANANTSAEEASLADARNKLAPVSSSIARLDSELFELKVQVASVRTPEEIQSGIDELEQEKTTLENRIAEIQPQLEASGSGTTNLSTLEQRMKNAETQAANASKALETATKNLDQRQTALSEAQNSNDYQVLVNFARYTMEQEGKDTADSAALATAIKSEASMRGGTYQSAFNAVQTAKKNYDTAKSEYEAAVEKYEQAQEAYNTTVKNYEEMKNGVDRIAVLKEELESAKARITEIGLMLPQAQQLKKQAEEDQKQYADVYRQIQAKENQRISLANEQSILNRTISDLNGTISSRKSSYEALAAEAQAAQQRLNAAIRASNSNQGNAELDALQAQIDAQTAVVAECAQQPLETVEIRAEAAGTVRSIIAAAGAESVPGAVLAVLNVAQESNSVDVPVTAEQAACVKTGDTAETVDGASAVLTEIADDPLGGGDKKILRYQLDGTREASSEIVLVISLGQTDYDMVIPATALREDENGKYVLVVLVDRGPLGAENYAARVGVEVLAEDGSNAAISGLLADDLVILDQTIQDGDRIAVG